MTFAAYETGAGVPAEGYEFLFGGTYYRYTSAAQSIVISSNTYTPEAIGRSEPSLSKESRSGEITITLPASNDVAQLFADIQPSSMPTLTIYRRHLNDGDNEVVAFWKGYVSSCQYKDAEAELICQPVTRLFQRTIPRFTYTSACNHTLYDGGCLIEKNNFKHVATVNSIVGGVQLEIAGLAARAAALGPSLSGAEQATYWQGGYISYGGEYRMILQGNVSGNANLVRILMPFKSLLAGETVTVFAGCAHTVDICNRKFNNALRFGGFPYVPSQNPFAIDLDSH